MYNLIKKISQKTYQPLVTWYIKKDRNYTYKGIKLKILKGVFHPGLFFSTKFTLNELGKTDLHNKEILDLGCGSGLISFFCAKKGAKVIASDISSIVMEGLKYNLSQPHLKQLPVTIIQSDLFESIPVKLFDYIIITPPYYPRNPKNEEEMAWYCGTDFGYFEKLFKQIRPYISDSTEVWLTFSQDCDLVRISAIAKKNDLELKIRTQKRILWEKNYIYTLHTRDAKTTL